jgi:hypothetical protein
MNYTVFIRYAVLVIYQYVRFFYNVMRIYTSINLRYFTFRSVHYSCV